MKEIIKYTINQKVKGVDTYYNNGSIWLIFTDDKKWVIELTKEGTLWYNFYFFQDCFKYLSLDVVENQHYITEWVEDIIQYGVKETKIQSLKHLNLAVEDITQNGVRSTQTRKHYYSKSVDGITQNGVWLDTAQLVEDTIQNGIKDVIGQIIDAPELVNDAIQNGVKNTFDVQVDLVVQVEDTIQNGVRHTGHNVIRSANSIEDVIKNGIKETKHGIHFFEDTTENVIKNGVKETKSPGADGDLLSTIEWMESNNAESVPEMIDNVIENGIKEVKELPDQSGELKGYSDYYNRQEDRTYPHTKTVDDVIRVGIKETNWRKVDNHPTYLDTIINK